MPVILESQFIIGGKPLEFRSYGQLLRYLADNYSPSGHRRSPGDFHLGSRERDGTVSGFSHYAINEVLGRWHMTVEQLDALMNLQQRYRAYVHYLTEVLPEWTDTKTIPYADNSTEVVQTNKWGGTRQVMTVAPHGDLC